MRPCVACLHLQGSKIAHTLSSLPPPSDLFRKWKYPAPASHAQRSEGGVLKDAIAKGSYHLVKVFIENGSAPTPRSSPREIATLLAKSLRHPLTMPPLLLEHLGGFSDVLDMAAIGEELSEELEYVPSASLELRFGQNINAHILRSDFGCD